MIGHVPDAVRVIKAARYLGCTPFELLDKPIGWQELALLLEDIENEQASKHK